MKDFDQLIADLKELISIKSVYGEPCENAPFGKGVKRALDSFLALAESFGFKTINYENYIGEVVFGEELNDDSAIGIIGHLDVVPEGTGWATDPYNLTEINGALVGRGISDDKAPMLLCLYALKELKESGIKPNRKIRLFVGCDEESGWRDAEYFKNKYGFPKYGFSPDGDFPLSYAEKGMYIISFTMPAFKNFFNVLGGTVVNAVCGRASMQVKPNAIDKELIANRGLILEGDKITAVGKSAHGSHPELGDNAIKKLIEYIVQFEPQYKQFLDCAFNDKTKIMELKNEQGIVTISPDIIAEEGGKVKITCDCRVPAPFSIADVLPKLNEFGFPFSVVEKHNPVMTEKDGWFVKTLINAYQEVTGENVVPISQCGCTFARVFEKGCAFGPEFLAKSNSIHEPNEKMDIEDLKKSYKIYLSAIKKLIVE